MSILLALMALAPCGQAKDPVGDPALEALVNAERGFARMSVEHGTQAAFLANLADDAVLFRPRAVAGKQWTAENPFPPDGVLSWWPSHAEISSGGDLGFTTGPYEYGPKGAEPRSFGYFVSVWKKQPDGAWKVALDAGSRNERPNPRPAAWSPPGVTHAAVKPIAPEKARAALLAADGEFGKLYATLGPTDAYNAFLAEDARYHRDGIFPLAGRAAIVANRPADPSVFTWTAEKAEVSGNGDFGYTFGLVQARKDSANAAVDHAMYLKVWRRGADGSWKIVLDLVNPLPPSKPAGQ